MKRGLLLPLILLTAFQAFACVVKPGELRVRNRSASEVWVSVANSEPRKISAWSNWSLFYSENVVLGVSYIGNYVFANTVEQIVRPGLISTVEVLASGGAIALANDDLITIEEVYISASDELDWGSDDLAGSLGPGQNTLWTLTAGSWDLKLVDAQRHEYYKYGLLVELNQTMTVDFSSFVKSAPQAGPKSSP